jgi:hypothetical protein
MTNGAWQYLITKPGAFRRVDRRKGGSIKIVRDPAKDRPRTGARKRM